MIVLAVDTSSEHGSLALARDTGLLEEVALPPGRYSATLHAEIVGSLLHSGLTIQDISGYAVTTGPGVFTGVGLGVTAVKGLDEAHGRPVIAVSTLQTISFQALAAIRPALPCMLAPILDARRGQIFAAVLCAREDGLQPILNEMVCSLGSFLARVRDAGIGAIQFCGPDLNHFTPEIEKAGCSAASLIRTSPRLAASLAAIAVERLRQGLGVPPSEVDANYVRPSDAELFWKE